MPKQTPYQKGYKLENKAVKMLESWYHMYTIRSAGSKTPIDIIAGNGIETFAVQVKAEGSEHKVDWNTLREWAEGFQAIPVLLVYCRGGRWKVYLDEEKVSKVKAQEVRKTS